MNHATDLSADEALQRLIDGNARFLRGEARRAIDPRETVSELALGQKPFATILGCSDSRVPPEWIFDAGLGELFVVRVAGNVLSAEVAGSLQYAGSHLKTPLMVVLGHEKCGAIQAALQVKFQQTQQLWRIQLLVDSILPALDGLDLHLPPAAQLALDAARDHGVARRPGPCRGRTREVRRRHLRDRNRPGALPGAGVAMAPLRGTTDQAIERRKEER
jgi:carbonic anhydrase